MPQPQLLLISIIILFMFWLAVSRLHCSYVIFSRWMFYHVFSRFKAGFALLLWILSTLWYVCGWLKRSISHLSFVFSNRREQRLRTCTYSHSLNAQVTLSISDDYTIIFIYFILHAVYFLLPPAVVLFPTLRSPLCEQFAFPGCEASGRKIESLHAPHAHGGFFANKCAFLIFLLHFWQNYYIKTLKLEIFCYFTTSFAGTRTNGGDSQQCERSERAWYYRKTTGKDTGRAWVGDRLVLFIGMTGGMT